MGQGGQEVLVGPTTHKDMATNDITHSNSSTVEELCDFLEESLQGINIKLANKGQVISQQSWLTDQT